MIDPSGATCQSSNIGIGTDDPFSELCIHGGAADNDGSITFEVDGSDWLIGIDDGDADKMKICQSDTMGTNTRVTITAGGFVGIGTTTPAWKLDVYDDSATYAMRVYNDGDDSNRLGLKLRNGSYDNSGTNHHIVFEDGNGDVVGQIRSTSGTVTYNDFTGSHDVSIPAEYNERGYDYGTVMCLKSTYSDPERPRQPAYNAQPSIKKYDKSVFGIYSSKYADKENLHQVYALGDGHILVCDEAGNINVGDYLTTSSVQGHAMKQDDERIHNYTIAKALEAVDWEEEKGNVKLISCTYHAQ